MQNIAIWSHYYGILHLFLVSCSLRIQYFTFDSLHWFTIRQTGNPKQFADTIPISISLIDSPWNFNLCRVKLYTLTPDLETPLAKPSKYGKQTLFLSVNVTARSVCSSNACGWGLRCQSAVCTCECIYVTAPSSGLHPILHEILLCTASSSHINILFMLRVQNVAQRRRRT